MSVMTEKYILVSELIILEEKQNEKTIDLVKVALLIWDKILWVVLAVAVLALGAFLVTRIFWVKKYTSEIQLYTVMSVADDNTQAATVTTQQINIRRSVAALYVKAIKKSDSLDTMVTKLKDKNFSITSGKLNSVLNVYIDNDASEIIHVRVTTTDPDLSFAICEIVGDEAEKLVGNAYIGCTVAVFNNPSKAVNPNSSGALRNAAIGGVAGLVISVAIIIMIYLFDKSIKSGEDLEKLSEIRYIGDIPDVNESFKGSRYEYVRHSKSKSS